MRQKHLQSVEIVEIIKIVEIFEIVEIVATTNRAMARTRLHQSL
jgi:hypothetical protein